MEPNQCNDIINRRIRYLFDKGDYEKTIEYLMIYLDNKKKVEPKNKFQHLKLLKILIESCIQENKYHIADQYYQEFKEIYEYLVINNSDIIDYKNISIHFLLCVERIPEAWIECKETLSLIKKFKIPINRNFKFLGNYAGVLYNLGKYEEAKTKLITAITNFEELTTENALLYFIILYQLASLYHETQDYNKAIGITKYLLSNISKANLENSSTHFQLVNLLGLVYSDIDDHKQAMGYFDTAKKLLEPVSQKNYNSYAAVLTNYSRCYYRFKRHDRALELANEAKKYLKESNLPQLQLIASNMELIGAIYFELGKHKEAFESFKYSFLIKKKLFGTKHPEMATCYYNFSIILRDYQIYDLSLKYINKSLEIINSSRFKDKSFCQKYLLGKAAIHHDLGHFKESEIICMEILMDTTRINETDLYETYLLLARNYIFLKLKDESLNAYKEAFLIEDRLLGKIFSTVDEESRSQFLKRIIWNNNYFFSIMAMNYNTDENWVNTAYNLFLKRKGLTIDILRVQLENLMQIENPELLLNFELLEKKRKELKNLILSNVISDTSTNIKEQLNVILSIESLETKISQSIDEIDITKYISEINFDIVYPMLSHENLLIDIILIYQDAIIRSKENNGKTIDYSNYFAFIVDKTVNSIIKIVNIGSVNKIDEIIKKYTSYIREYGELLQYQDENEDSTENREMFQELDNNNKCLYLNITQPLIPIINGKKHLIISPEGEFYKLPFEILPINEKDFLIDIIKISYIISGRCVESFNRNIQNEFNDPIVIADPDYNYAIQKNNGEKNKPDNEKGNKIIEFKTKIFNRRDSRNRGFEQRAYFKIEGELVSSLLKCIPKMGREATKSFIQSIRSPSILHICTHAFYYSLLDTAFEPNISDEYTGLEKLETVPQPTFRSGIALAGINFWINNGKSLKNLDDGLLTSEEVIRINLFNTDLVVLSACETGLGDIKIGEGVFGIGRSFIIAGAKSLIMSLWSVDDEKTFCLMNYFYRNITSGETKVDALRNAQLKIKSSHPHPYFWGAFILNGDFSYLSNIIYDH